MRFRKTHEKRFDQIQRQSKTDRIKHIGGEIFFYSMSWKYKKLNKQTS